MAFGYYSVEYYPKVHGPYDPVRFFDKPDKVNVGGMVFFYARMKHRRNYKYH